MLGIARLPGQTIVQQCAHGNAGLARDLLDYVRGEEYRTEYGRYLLGEQLLNQRGNFLCRRLGGVVRLDCADYRVAVTQGKVSERVVIGQQPAIRLWNRCRRRTYGLIECNKTGRKLVEVVLVVLSVIRVMG